MKRFLIATAVFIAAFDARAQHRATITPSLEITQVTDDNLNFSATEPLRDTVRHITPGLAFRFDSPRWSSHVSFGADGEQYEDHRALDNLLARERGNFDLQYRATQRLILAIDSSYVATNTLADLNVETGLLATRLRGRRFSATPSASFRMTQMTTLTASASASDTRVAGGFGIRAQQQSLAFDRRVTQRDVMSLTLEHRDIEFTGSTTQSVRSEAVIGAWTRSIGVHDRVTLQVGPRMTDRKYSVDVAGSFTRAWKRGSFGLAVAKTQSTIVGYAGTVDSESAQANIAIGSARNLMIFIAPGVFRTTHDELQGLVYRMSGGARYTLTSFLQAQVIYSHDTQNGAIDPFQPDAKFGHSTLSIGFTTRPHLRDTAR